jgi:hypothetical protein
MALGCGRPIFNPVYMEPASARENIALLQDEVRLETWLLQLRLLVSVTPRIVS